MNHIQDSSAQRQLVHALLDTGTLLALWTINTSDPAHHLPHLGQTASAVMMTAVQHAGFAIRQVIAIRILISTDPTLGGAQIKQCSVSHQIAAALTLAPSFPVWRLFYLKRSEPTLHQTVHLSVFCRGPGPRAAAGQTELAACIILFFKPKTRGVPTGTKRSRTSRYRSWQARAAMLVRCPDHTRRAGNVKRSTGRACNTL